MPPSHRIYVDPAELRSLSAQWRHQEWDLRSARDALSVPLDALVNVDLGGFLVAWAVEIGDLAVRVESIAEALVVVGSDFAQIDSQVADR